MPPKNQSSLDVFYQSFLDKIQNVNRFKNVCLDVVSDMNTQEPVLKISFVDSLQAKTFSSEIHARYKIGSRQSQGQDPKPHTNNDVYFTLIDITAFCHHAKLNLPQGFSLTIGTKYTFTPLPSQLLTLPTTQTYTTTAHKNVFSVIAAGNLTVKTFSGEHDLNFILNQINDPILNRSMFSRYAKTLKRTPASIRTKANPLTGQTYTYQRQPSKLNTHTKKTATTLMPSQTKLMSLFYKDYIGCAVDINTCEIKNYLFKANAVTDGYFWCKDSPHWSPTVNPLAKTLLQLKTDNQNLNQKTRHTELVVGLPTRQLATFFVQNNARSERLSLLEKMHETKAKFGLSTDIPMWLLETASSTMIESDAPAYGPYTIFTQLNDILKSQKQISSALLDQVILSALDTLNELLTQLSQPEIQTIIDMLVNINHFHKRLPFEGMDGINYLKLAYHSEKEDWIACFPRTQAILSLIDKDRLIAILLKANDFTHITTLIAQLTPADQKHCEAITQYAFSHNAPALVEALMKQRIWSLSEKDINFILSQGTLEWMKVLKRHVPLWYLYAVSLEPSQFHLLFNQDSGDQKKLLNREAFSSMLKKQNWSLLLSILQNPTWKTFIKEFSESSLLRPSLFNMQWLLECAQHQQWELFKTLLPIMQKSALNQFATLTDQMKFIDVIFESKATLHPCIFNYFSKNPTSLIWEDTSGKTAAHHFLLKDEYDYINTHFPSFSSKLKLEKLVQLIEQVSLNHNAHPLINALLVLIGNNMEAEPSAVIFKNENGLYVLRHFILAHQFSLVTLYLKKHQKALVAKHDDIASFFQWVQAHMSASPNDRGDILNWLKVISTEVQIIGKPFSDFLMTVAQHYKDNVFLKTLLSNGYQPSLTQVSSWKKEWPEAFNILVATFSYCLWFNINYSLECPTETVKQLLKLKQCDVNVWSTTIIQQKRWDWFEQGVMDTLLANDTKNIIINLLFKKLHDLPDAIVTWFYKRYWSKFSANEQPRVINALIEHCKCNFIDTLESESTFQTYLTSMSYKHRAALLINLARHGQDKLFSSLARYSCIEMSADQIKEFLTYTNHGPYLEAYLMHHPEAYSMENVKEMLLLWYTKTFKFEQANALLKQWSSNSPLSHENLSNIEIITMPPLLPSDDLALTKKSFVFRLMNTCIQLDYQLNLSYYMNDPEYMAILIQHPLYDAEIKALLSQKPLLFDLSFDVFSLLWNHKKITLQDVSMTMLLNETTCRSSWINQMSISNAEETWQEIAVYINNNAITQQVEDELIQALSLNHAPKSSPSVAMVLAKLIKNQPPRPRLEKYLIEHPEIHSMQGLIDALLLQLIKTHSFTKATRLIKEWASPPLSSTTFSIINQLAFTPDHHSPEKKAFILVLMNACIRWNHTVNLGACINDIDYMAILVEHAKYDTTIKTLLSQKPLLFDLSFDVFSLLWSRKKIALQDVSMTMLLNHKISQKQWINLMCEQDANAFWLKIIETTHENAIYQEQSLMQAFSLETTQNISLSIVKLLLSCFNTMPDFQKLILSTPCCKLDSECQKIGLILDENKTPWEMLNSLKTSSLEAQKLYFHESELSAQRINECFDKNDYSLIEVAASAITDNTLIKFCTTKGVTLTQGRKLAQLTFQARLSEAATATEVLAVLQTFRTLDTSCNGWFFERQRHLKLSFWGHRFGEEALSRTGTEFYKLAKIRLLELMEQSKISNPEKESVENFLSTHRTRFAFTQTRSFVTYKSSAAALTR